MKKIVLSLIFVSTSFTLVGMEAHQVTEQPRRQLMEIEEPLIPQENDECRRTLGKCLLYCCIISCMAVTCVTCKQCICNKYCPSYKQYPI